MVYDKFVYQCEEPAQLADYLNAKAKSIKSEGGLTVTFDKAELNDIRDEDEMKSDSKFGAGFFIPMHMIAYINYTVRLLSGSFPVSDEGQVRQ